MDKFFIWVGRYRKPIGYTIASLNILGGISYLINGQDTYGWLQIFLGVFIAYDTVATL